MKPQRAPKLYQFDPRVMAGGRGEAPVARQERCVKRLGQRDIGGIIGRQIVAQVPDARQKEIMRISPQSQIGQVAEGETAPCTVDIALRGVAPDHLGYFDIEQMRRVERLPGSEQPILHGACSSGAQEGLKHGRGVDDDHPPSRSARTISAGGTEGLVSVRLRNRARNSSIVGLSVTCRISLSRKSDNDIPAKAARDLSCRCSASGTLRIWIIIPMFSTYKHVQHMSNRG